MADSKISALPAVTSLVGTDEFVIATSGASKKITAANLQTAIGGGGGGGGSSFIDMVTDSSVRTLTASTYEDITGTSLTFTAEAGAKYLVMAFLSWRWVNANWQHHVIRAVIDGATTGVTPTTVNLAIENNNPANTLTWFNSTALFILDGLAAGAHTLKLQSWDDNSGIDRSFAMTEVVVMKVGSGSTGGILGSKIYAPAAQTVYSSSSTTLADVDATNAVVSFIAPPSGNVLIRVNCWIDFNIAGGGDAFIGLREGAADLSGTVTRIARSNTNGDQQQYMSVPMCVTGLTPGSSHTYKLSFARAVGGILRLIVQDGAGTGTASGWGPLIMEVLAL